MLKVITIDFWNTLFDSSNGIKRNAYRQDELKKHVKKHGIVLKEEDFQAALAASWENFNSIWLTEMRTPSTKDSVEFLWNYLKLPKDNKAIEKITETFSNSILHYPPLLIPGVRDSLEFLHEKYTLGLISDTGFSPGLILKDLMEREDIIQYFSAFSFSDETGLSKPHPIAYHTILNQFKCHPSDSLHIGDNELTDIKGAKALGMKAILFIGDQTSIIDPKTEETKADAVFDSWEGIVEFLS